MTSPSRTDERQSAFTLIELVVAIMLLGILAGIAAPRLMSAAADAETTACVTEAQAILKALELYAAANGTLPSDSVEAACPTGLEEFIAPQVFTEHQPLGGRWDYSPAYPGVGRGVVEVSRPTVASTLLMEIDSRWDDGAADTGWIQQPDPNDFLFLLD